MVWLRSGSGDRRRSEIVHELLHKAKALDIGPRDISYEPEILENLQLPIQLRVLLVEVGGKVLATRVVRPASFQNYKLTPERVRCEIRSASP